MKLARKITLALGLLTCLVLTAEGVLEVEREVALVTEELERNHQLLGASFGSAFARTWQTEGGGEAFALLEQANRGQAAVRLRWVWLDAPPGTPTAPRVDGRLLQGRHAGETVVLRTGGGSTGSIVSYTLDSLGGRMGALEVSEPLTALTARVSPTVVGNAVATVVIAALFILAALWLGRWLVGRPVRTLADMARRVGAGDLSARVHLHQRDELGELADVLNQMAADLSVTRDALAAETERRLATVDQLRHADRLTTVGKLAAGVAHELGTPLNVVSGRSKMIATREVEGEEALESARIIHEQSAHMTRIIRQLLDFARPRPPRRSPEEVDALLTQTHRMLERMATRHGVALEVAPSGEMRVDVDEGQLRQVLTNLVVNGLQACSAGGRVRLSAHRARAVPPPEVGGPERAWVRLDVEDTGRGIPPDVLPNIFEPFFTTKDVGEGTGLGLSVSYGLVRDHGGWIGVESTPGRGSRFSVWLPESGQA